MPASGGPGQQAIANAIRAMPATRATGMAAAVRSSPNNNCPTSDGVISNAAPVVASVAAAKIKTFFIVSISGHQPVDAVTNDRELLLCCGAFLRFEPERQLVELAGELERRFIAIFQQRNSGARVQPHVESLIFRKRNRGSVLKRIPRHLLAVDGQHSCAALAQARTVDLEVEDDGVLAGLQFRPLPDRALEVEK